MHDSSNFIYSRLGCGHCQKLAPIYEQLAKNFASDPNCVIAKLDGDKAKDVIRK